MLKKLNLIEEYFLLGTLAFNVVLVFVQVIMRYVFHHSLFWSEEVARFLFLWFSWIGTSFAVREGAHVKVTVLLDRLEGKAKSILELSSLVIWIAFSIFLAFQGWKMTMFVASMQQTSPALYIPMYLVYASVPVGSMLMTARLLLELKNFLLNALSGRGEAL